MKRSVLGDDWAQAPATDAPSVRPTASPIARRFIMFHLRRRRCSGNDDGPCKNCAGRTRSVEIRSALGAAPFLHQHAAAAWVALRGGRGGGDAVGAEMAEAVAQLAPGGEDARALVEGERDGPDAALGALAGLVALDDPDLLLAPPAPAP